MVMRSSIAVLLGIAFICSAAVVGAGSNRTFDRMENLSLSDRNRVLGAIVNQANFPCRPSFSEFKVQDERDSSVFYLVTCEGGENYMVQIEADSGGSTRVIDCRIAKTVGVDCFHKF
jgi:hypothetical protein